jgi:hypothetical protein
MAPFLYRCPNTDRQIQGFVADDPTEDSDEYQLVTCLACAQAHFVNPNTGKVLGADTNRISARSG